MRITAGAVPPKTIQRAERGTVSGDTESGGGNVGRDKDQTAEAAAESVATAIATKRAAALSSALAEDDEAVPESSPGRKSLFASRGRSGGDEQDVDGDDGGGVGQESTTPVNIAVVSRCRPLLTREMKRGVRAAVFCDGNEIVVSDERLPTKRSRRFGFDRVFGKTSLAFRPPFRKTCLVTFFAPLL